MYNSDQPKDESLSRKIQGTVALRPGHRFALDEFPSAAVSRERDG